LIFFNINVIEDYFTLDYLELEPIKVYHTNDMESTGLFIRKNNIFISGDTKLDYRLKDIYEKSDTIFHDCSFSEHDDCVHAQFRFSKLLPKEIKQKIYLYHYNSELDLDKINRDTINSGFKGIVKPSDSFTFY